MPHSEKLRRAYWVALSASAFLWGTGYPHFFRYPLYLAIPVLATPLLRRKPMVALLAAAGGGCVSGFYYASRGSVGSAGWLFAVIAWLGLAYEVTREMGADVDDALLMKWITQGIRIACVVAVVAAVIDTGLRAADMRVQLFVSNALPAGVYPEPSHAGFTLGPALAVLFAAPTTRRFAVLVAAALVVFVPSGTLVVGAVVGLIISALRRRPAIAFATVIVLPFAALLATLSGDSLVTEHKYASAFVWLNGYDRAIPYAQESWVGVGPFGWIEDAADPENIEDLSALNIRDLASLAPFVLASFGALGVGLLVVALWFLSRLAGRPSTTGSMAALALTLVSTHLFRWSGFLLSPLPVVLVVLLATRRTKIT